MRKRFLDGKQPADDPLDIAVNGGGAMVEGDRGNRRGGIVADPGEGPQLGQVLRQLPAMALGDGTSTGMQVAGAGVITEPLPQIQHLVERGRGKRANIGKTRHESVKIGTDGGDGGLLQHDLAEPDPIRVGAPTGRRAPGEIAAMAVVPRQEHGRIGQPLRRFG